MSFLVVRSLPLGSKSTPAWKAAGGVFVRRGSTPERIAFLAQRNESEFILNLGKSTFMPTPDTPCPVWNLGESILPLLWPGRTRELLGDLMPPQEPGDVWVKQPGFGGRGKVRLETEVPLVLPPQWDWQSHVDGQEWRLITVGHRVVQDLKRFGENGNRSYEWVPMKETPVALKALAREAAKRLPGMNVTAWDLIIDNQGQPFLFEGNSCPGVNEATTSRIYKEIIRQQEESNV